MLLNLKRLALSLWPQGAVTGCECEEGLSESGFRRPHHTLVQWGFCVGKRQA